MRTDDDDDDQVIVLHNLWLFVMIAELLPAKGVRAAPHTLEK